MKESAKDLEALNARIVACERCPRLRDYCREVAQQKRAAFRDWTYHGKPVPNLLAAPPSGSTRLLIVGLAPAAHGANRTGRMFTGDRSGDFLYRAMHEAGLANQPAARHADDGLKLHRTVITAACHCAPPANKPTRQELATCSHWLEQTFDLLPDLRVVLCLGAIALDAVLRLYQGRGLIKARARYRFGHAAEHAISGAATVVCSYHPSQQNTFTGKLTPRMLRAVLERARELAAT